jgi:uncharacterized membrane protein YeaQ/YmgE (transglycosylase-associated protein family)
MEAFGQIIVSLVIGAAGGNFIAAVFKKSDLGYAGNTIIGFIGGFSCDQLLGAPGSLQNVGIIGDIVASAIGGVILTGIVGSLKNLTLKP